MTIPPLSIHLVTWNSADVLPALLASLQRQTRKDFRVVVVDNASTDTSVALVAAAFPTATILRNRRNLGFCAAHNQAIRCSESPFMAVVNPDIVLEPNVVATLLPILERDASLASVGGKLLNNRSDSGTIDAAGLLAYRTHQVTNRGEGEPDRGQYDTPEEVFGLSGAFLILRRSALQSVEVNGEFFDESFFAYKEDVDLAWRLRLAGWRHWYDPSAVLEHRRRIRRERTLSIVRRGRAQPALIRRWSYRNHWMMLLKLTRFSDWFLPYPALLIYEVGKLCYLALRERSTVGGLLDALRVLPSIREKRRIAFRQRKASPQSVAAWFR